MSINPDAHSIDELDLTHWGVLMARKSGVSAERVLNCLTLAKISEFLTSRKARRSGSAKLSSKNATVKGRTSATASTPGRRSNSTSLFCRRGGVAARHLPPRDRNRGTAEESGLSFIGLPGKSWGAPRAPPSFGGSHGVAGLALRHACFTAGIILPSLAPLVPP